MATRSNLHACRPVRRTGDDDRKARRHQLSAVCRALLCAWLWLGISTAAVAETTVELAPAAANVTEYSIKVGVTALSAIVQLRNSGKEDRYYREQKLLTRTSDGASRPASWKREGAATDDKTIPKGAQIALQLSAELPAAGVYETFIDSYGKDDKGVEVPDRRIRVLVTREADAPPAELPAEFMVDPKPAAETWSGSDETRHYILTLRNTTTKRLAFRPAAIVGFTNKSGEDMTATASAQKPSVDATACGSSLDPAVSCAIDLTLKNALFPGEYQVNIGVAGEGGGWSQRTQTIRVRFPWWIAFFVIVLGALAGTYVQAWRSRGRPAVAALIELTRLREAATRLGVPPDVSVAPLIRLVLADIDDVESQARKNADVTTEVERLRLWIRHLTPATEISRRFGKLSVTGRSALQAQFTAVMRGVEKSRPTEADRNELETLLEAATENLNNWPNLEQSIAKAAPLLAAMDALLDAAAARPPADIAALKTLRDELAAAVNGAKASLPVPPAAGDYVSDRQTTLDRAIDKAEQHAVAAARQIADALSVAKQQQLGTLQPGDQNIATLQASIAALAAWKADASGKPVVVRLADLTDLLQPGRNLAAAAAAAVALPANVPPIDIPTQVLIPPRGASLLELEASQSNNELLTNAILLGATGLAGVLALWVPNATWGSWGDVIGAVMAGLAARVVLGDAGSTVKQ